MSDSKALRVLLSFVLLPGSQVYYIGCRLVKLMLGTLHILVRTCA